MKNVRNERVDEWNVHSEHVRSGGGETVMRNEIKHDNKDQIHVPAHAHRPQYRS